MTPSGPPQAAWREQLRQVMFEATLDEAQARSGVRNPLFNYRWEHVLAVHALALRLARLTGADEEVVEAAAWLHDVRKLAGEAHPRQGAAFARRFLPQTDFPPDKIERVAQAIEEHRGLWREEPLQLLESAVLWDADKLAKLGLTAAFHWLGNTFSRGESVTLEALIDDLSDADWQEKTVASMHTAPARKAAQQRLERFQALWRELREELGGGDVGGGD